MTVPYENASSGGRAREEIVKLLQAYGCESVGFMDNFEKQSLLLAFTHRGRQIQVEASAQGWAVLYLKEHPYSYRMKRTQKEHEARALKQGMVAINSILRDWVKGQVTAIECGILSFEAVFMPHMLTNDGRPLIERLAEKGMLPSPASPPTGTKD